MSYADVAQFDNDKIMEANAALDLYVEANKNQGR